VASLPGYFEDIPVRFPEVVLDKITKETASPHDPTAVRRTSYTLLAHSCTQEERILTYLVELRERGPNIKPTFPVVAVPSKEANDDTETETKRRRKSTPTRIAPKETA
jgi:hypothetical protein